MCITTYQALFSQTRPWTISLGSTALGHGSTGVLGGYAGVLQKVWSTHQLLDVQRSPREGAVVAQSNVGRLRKEGPH